MYELLSQRIALRPMLYNRSVRSAAPGLSNMKTGIHQHYVCSTNGAPGILHYCCITRNSVSPVALENEG